MKARASLFEVAAVQPIEAVTKRQKPAMIMIDEM
jgi:hypothetical protein